MKEELKKLLYILKNKEDIYNELQVLWDRVDPRDFQYYTEQLTYKLKDIIKVRGLLLLIDLYF